MEGRFSVVKVDGERQNVFGWAYVARNGDGAIIVDKQGDYVEPDDLEFTAYDFVLHSRASDVMHAEVTKAELIESMMFTPEKLEKLGLPAGSLPIGWWTGFHVSDTEAWDGIRKGDYAAFSIGGSGTRVPVTLADGWLSPTSTPSTPTRCRCSPSTSRRSR